MAGGDQDNPAQTMIMLALIVGIFYFFMIRPQTKKAKALKQFRANIGNGDKIVTIGGVHGKILEVKDTTIIIEVEGGNRLRIDRSAISAELTNGTGQSELAQQKSK